VTHLQNDLGFDPNAPNNVAAILYRLARARRGAVLHLGSGVDGIARALSTLADMKVTRVMSDRDGLEAETTEGLDAFVADPEVAGWYAVLEGRTYDVVIVADLPEQVRDPGKLLRDLREQRLLADDGRLLVSFANLAHESVADELSMGGSTRLHWYTLASMRRLLEASGYLVEGMRRTHRALAAQQSSGDNETQTYEYVVHALPTAAGPQLALLRTQLDEMTQRLADAEKRQDQTNALLEEERAAFRVEIGRGADELEQLQNKIMQSTDERSALRKEIRGLHDRLADLQRDLAVTTQAKDAADQRLEKIKQTRSYRWSRVVSKASHRVGAPLRFGKRRPRGGR
jgi:Methyltransferase domain